MAMTSLDSTRAAPAGRQLLFGLQIDPVRMEEVIARCRRALITRSQLMIGVVNAAKVVNLRSDPILRESLIECDLLLADGQSVVWASRLLGHPLPARVAGIDVFEELLGLAHRDGRPVYLLGARPEVLQKLESKLQERFPGLKIAGRHHGYFQDNEGPRIASAIRDSGADMLFLGMTSPKKEIFLSSFRKILGVPILHGVGGSFDVLAGITKRAPLSWQRLGMEWAYRLLQEPRRMWRRYLTTNAGFVLLTARELFRASPAFQPGDLENPRQLPDP
jgi:N-acetylglucosaminyldiphosphoundecaprenol N-acetyl-beta-D-mannosaminyltransferase